jgi:hypothetical protein
VRRVFVPALGAGSADAAVHIEAKTELCAAVSTIRDFSHFRVQSFYSIPSTEAGGLAVDLQNSVEGPYEGRVLIVS